MNDQTSNDDHDQNTSAETWESEMTSAFDRRVRDLHEAPLTLAAVKGKAVNIRRKRRAAAAGGLLAAAAVITPVAFLAADSLGDDSSNAPIATQTPTVLDPTDPTPAPADRGVAYLEGPELHRSDGTVITLPSAGYQDAAALGDRVVAVRNVDGLWSVDVIEDGDVVDSYQAYSTFVVSGSHDLVAFVTTDGDLTTVWDDGEKVLTGGLDTQTNQPTALVGGPGCEGDSCAVHVEDSGPGEANFIVDGDGRRTQQRGIIGVNDVTPDGGLVVAQTESTDDGSCSAVLDAAGGTVFETCEYLLEQISDDGRHVIGLDPQVDGQGPLFYVVLDLDGNEVARYAPEAGYLYDIAWVDDDTVVATVYDGAGWRIVSQAIGPGGDITDVAGPAPGDDVTPAYYLAT